MGEPQDVVIVDGAGTEHHFPAGFDPKRAAAIVRQQEPARSDVQVVGKVQSDDPREQIQEPTTWWGGFSQSILNQMGVGNPDSPLSRAARPQTAGDVATLLLPNAAGLVRTGVEAIPTTAKAGRMFDAVSAAAKDVPVNITGPGNAALQFQQLASRGGSPSRAVNQLVGRITDPNQGEMLYPEARQWASNLSQLSADEFNRLKPAAKRLIGDISAQMNSAIGDAAGTVGQRGTYENAMNTYRQAKQLQGYKDALIQALQKNAVPFGLGAGVAGGAAYGISKLKGLLGE